MNAPQPMEVLERADQESKLAAPSDSPKRLNVIEQAIRTGATADQLERLLALQVELDNHQLVLLKEKRAMDDADRARLARLAYKESFAKFKKKNIVIPKTKPVVQKAKNGGPGPRFEQTELEFVSGLLSIPLAEEGLSFRFDPVIERKGNRVEWVSITCHLEHVQGYGETVTMGGPPDDSGAKNAQQEVQSTVTFWSRHTLLAVTGTPQAGMDNDGRGAQGYQDDQQQEQQQQADAPLLQAGQKAALAGLTSLNAWWGSLTEDQRKRLTPEFGAMRSAARKAVEAGNGGVAK